MCCLHTVSLGAGKLQEMLSMFGKKTAVSVLAKLLPANMRRSPHEGYMHSCMHANRHNNDRQG